MRSVPHQTLSARRSIRPIYTKSWWPFSVSEGFQNFVVAVLHHAHTTTKRGTWGVKWPRLADELPFVREYLGTGAYSFRDPGWNQRDALARVLEVNGRGEILNVIVRLCGAS